MKNIFTPVFLLLITTTLFAQKLDSTFNQDGIFTSYVPGSASVDQAVISLHEGESGKLITAATIGNSIVLTRRNDDGSRDLSYGVNGYSPLVRLFNPDGTSQPDGKIVMVGADVDGFTYDIKIVRFLNDGHLDSSFGTNGVVIKDIGGRTDYLYVARILADGKIVVTGRSDSAGYNVSTILRYNEDGTIDSTFGDNGVLIFDPGLSTAIIDLAILPDGNMLALGKYILPETDYFIARFLPDGILDSSFRDSGYFAVHHTAQDDIPSNLAVMPDGRFVVGVSWLVAAPSFQSSMIVRYLPDGTTDAAAPVKFRGLDVSTISRVQSTPGDEIIICGWNTSREDPSGTVIQVGQVMTMNDQGAVIGQSETPGKSKITRTLLMSSGQVISAHEVSGTDPDYILQRHNSLVLRRDVSFGSGGSVQEEYAASSKSYFEGFLMPDRRLMAYFKGEGPVYAEMIDEQGLVNSFGTVSLAFPPFPFHKIIRLQGYKLVVGGTDRIMRVSTSLQPDPAFGNNGTVLLSGNTVPVRSVLDVAIAPDNKIVVIAYESGKIILIRLHPNGSKDASFGTNGVLEVNGPFVRAPRILFQPDGKLTVIYTLQNGLYDQQFIMRVNTNGTVDSSFGSGGFIIVGRNTTPVMSTRLDDIFVQADGTIIAGLAVQPEGVSGYGRQLLRIPPDGIVDSSDFTTPLLHKISLQQLPGGKYIMAGSVPKGIDDTEILLQQFHADGTPDSSFGNDGSYVTDVTQINDAVEKLVLDGNRLYVLGNINFLGSEGLIVRYLLDNTSPVVTITSPVTGTVIDAGNLITVQASVAPVEGGWNKVEFLNEGVLIATDNAEPYEVSASTVEPGNYWVSARAISNNGDTAISSSVFITIAACSSTGAVIAEGYLNIPGGRIFDITTNPKYPDNPDLVVELNSFEFPNTGIDNFGARLRGYVCVPQSGLYTLNIAADNQGELWLSTDASPANKRLIASVYIPVPFRAWNSFSTQKSAPIFLLQGVKYYIEALHAENGGGDHLSVGWTLPNGVFEGPIPGNRLIPYATDSTSQLVVSRQFSVPEKSAGKLQVTANPNPSPNSFRLTVSSNSSEAIDIIVVDVMGRIVERVGKKQPNTSFSIGGSLVPGVYFIEVRQGNKKERISLLKNQR